MILILTRYSFSDIIQLLIFGDPTLMTDIDTLLTIVIQYCCVTLFITIYDYSSYSRYSIVDYSSHLIYLFYFSLL